MQRSCTESWSLFANLEVIQLRLRSKRDREVDRFFKFCLAKIVNLRGLLCFSLTIGILTVERIESSSNLMVLSIRGTRPHQTQ
jgi:hypothetical protein